MGILNVTPDSFSDGGRYIDPDAACEKALSMQEAGASIIDLGGESSRPGARELSGEEELERVLPVLEKLTPLLSVPLSIDTRKAEIARAALAAGAGIINDISGLRHDPEMLSVALEAGAAVIIMHMRGTPENMQGDPHYHDVTGEIYKWFDQRCRDLISRKLPRRKIIIDPGIGFGKRLEDNLEILGRIGDFHSLGFPLLVGYSRKSFIGTITGREPEERNWGGFAALGKCLDSGIQIIRVHDVKETADYLKVWSAIEGRRDRS
ncbi:MAG: dihydropteroate synthase [Candidatus Krumholzibacteriota bacterium]|nr:dihydropteroate synthase [Candidatus Krumholzibacteriota bacterium]